MTTLPKNDEFYNNESNIPVSKDETAVWESVNGVDILWDYSFFKYPNRIQFYEDHLQKPLKVLCENKNKFDNGLISVEVIRTDAIDPNDQHCMLYFFYDTNEIYDYPEASKAFDTIFLASPETRDMGFDLQSYAYLPCSEENDPFILLKAIEEAKKKGEAARITVVLDDDC